jgi:F-type H+/Na+-transporting ATPase subunit alpha
MSATQFQQLVADGRQVGEVVGVDRFLVKVRGLQPINVHALIMFEDGSKGYVHHVYEDYSMVLHLGDNLMPVGAIAVVQHERLVTRVGKNYIGRVISVLGEPLDGKGPIEADGTWPVFHNAPLLYERELLDTSFETGITALDIMFSLVRGQRMALVGDGKTGKSSLATQIAINQRSTDIITVYILIGKRRADLIELIDRLVTNNAMDKTIVIASTMFESLVLNYLAPYVAAAMGEYFWQQCNMDTFVVYDDLTSHAMAYREISLIAGVSPGRDSYPGDMFYTHSSLVERAGKLHRNHKTQTILPIVYAPGGDITAYLPTNVMSMTDGQWILDMRVFREVMRPAVSTGLSVTRVGGVAHNKRQKALAAQTSKALAAYKQAEEYAHFGSELSAESEADLVRGKGLYQLFNQAIGETYTLLEQQLLLDIVINLSVEESVDIVKLKSLVHEYVQKITNDDDPEQTNFDSVRDELKSQCRIETGDPLARKRAKATEEAGVRAAGGVIEDAESETAKESEQDTGKSGDAKKDDDETPKPKEDKSDGNEDNKKSADEKNDKPKHKLKVFGS